MIKKFLCLLVMAVMVSTTMHAQTKQEQEVAAAVEKLRKAMVDADKPALEHITDKGLSYGHSSGVIQDQATFVENIVNGNSDFVNIDLTDQTIYVSGNTAIVRHILSAATNDKGKGPGTVKLGVMTVWQKQKGDWKLLARQAFKVQ